MEKVLVCLVGSTRAHRLTFPGFKRQVIDQLNGDLALALCINENYDYNNAFWQHAKYRWTGPLFDDMGEAFDLAQNWLCQQNGLQAADWRLMLRLKGLWQGKIRSSDPQPSVASIATFCRWLLLHGMQQDDVLDRYDRFVITRSDFVWLCPHPPLSVLERSAIWVPDGEHYGGINDRHVVVSREDVADLLNISERYRSASDRTLRGDEASTDLEPGAIFGAPLDAKRTAPKSEALPLCNVSRP